MRPVRAACAGGVPTRRSPLLALLPFVALLPFLGVGAGTSRAEDPPPPGPVACAIDYLAAAAPVGPDVGGGVLDGTWRALRATNPAVLPGGNPGAWPPPWRLDTAEALQGLHAARRAWGAKVRGDLRSWGAGWVRGEPPAVLWRRYAAAHPGLPPPSGAAGHETEADFRARWDSTLDFPSLAAWSPILTEQGRWKVETFLVALSGRYADFDAYGPYRDLQDVVVAAESPAAGAAGAALLALEYALAVTYESHVTDLEAERAKALGRVQAVREEERRVAFTRFQSPDALLPVILRTNVPPSPEPDGGTEVSLPRSHEGVGGFAAWTGEGSASGGDSAVVERRITLATLAEPFTSATVPFQFSLVLATDRVDGAGGERRLAPAAVSAVAGRLLLRAKALPTPARPEGRWIEIPLVGTPAEGVSPWEAVREAEADPAVRADAFPAQAGPDGTPVPRCEVALAWSGVVVLRAEATGERGFTAVELLLEAQVRGAGPGEGARAFAALAAQPVLAQNVARIVGIGRRTRVPVGTPVHVEADLGLLPLSTTKATCRWSWGDGTPDETRTVRFQDGRPRAQDRPEALSHAYAEVGTWTLRLVLDPEVEAKSASAPVFEGEEGASFDEVVVEAVAPLPAEDLAYLPEEDRWGGQKQGEMRDAVRLLGPGAYWSTLGFRIVEDRQPDLSDLFRVDARPGQFVRLTFVPPSLDCQAVIQVRSGEARSVTSVESQRARLAPGGVCRVVYQVGPTVSTVWANVHIERVSPIPCGAYFLGIEVYDLTAPPASEDLDSLLERWPRGPTTERYHVTVYTSGAKEYDHGDEATSGTNARVFLTLHGDGGQMSPETELVAAEGDPFEEGSVDSFVLDLPALGDAARLRLRHDGSGEKAGWHVQRVRVKREVEGAEEAAWPERVFWIDRWLAADEEDGRLWVEVDAGRD